MSSVLALCQDQVPDGWEHVYAWVLWRRRHHKDPWSWLACLQPWCECSPWQHVELAVPVKCLKKGCRYCGMDPAREKAPLFRHKYHMLSYTVTRIEDRDTVHWVTDRQYRPVECWTAQPIHIPGGRTGRLRQHLDACLGQPFDPVAYWCRVWCCLPCVRYRTPRGFFCSSLVAHNLQVVGVLSCDRPPHTWTPAQLYRVLSQDS